jgi:outer membrane protein TolC
MKLLILLILANLSYGVTFNEVASSLENHQQVLKVKKMALAMEQGAKSNGSWGDPMFKLAAKNFPKNSLKDDETPMTGVEFGISQKIALSTKYGNTENSQISLARALTHQSQDMKAALVKSLWEVVINHRQVLEEKRILNENYNWIVKILKVTKKLYANGRASQQAVLDIEIRKSEIESELSNKKFAISQIEDQLNYLSSSLKRGKFSFKSVPWKILNGQAKSIKDFKELALKEKLHSKDFGLTAAKQNFVPDITVGVGYTKRSNVDNRGDFVGASISFPLPFSGKKYSNYARAVQEKYSALNELKDYRLKKEADSSILSREIKKLDAELKILNGKTIKFARNSRKITAKSYSLGNSSYVELLQSELKLQSLLLKKTLLSARRDIKKVTLKYRLGESLYE